MLETETAELKSDSTACLEVDRIIENRNRIHI